MPKKTGRRMQLQLQNLAPVMATSLCSRLFLTHNGLSLTLFSPLYVGISAGRWAGSMIQAGGLSSPILIRVGVPRGHRWACAPNDSERAVGLVEMVGGGQRGAIGKVLPACGKAGA